MFQQDTFRFLWKKVGTMILFGALAAAISFFLLMVTEKRFQSSMDFLVVQTSGNAQDFYAQFKSSEYLGKILSEAIYSERFINAVVETGKVHTEFLPMDKKDRLDTWQKLVQVEKNLELGIIVVTVRSDRERDASRIMEGISEVLTQRNTLFRGGDEKSVEIRILSGPITEQNPSITKTVAVVVTGFVAGLLLTALVFLIQLQMYVPRTKEMEKTEFMENEIFS